ncbi:MAG: hypothetical protein M1814_002833 [Vezdaea aestivalis]|nr:MAG: hypothetical protein M1814_002833 [Vezdaea aestivalis]
MPVHSKLAGISASPRSGEDAQSRHGSSPLTAGTPVTPSSLMLRPSGPRIVINRSETAPQFRLPAIAPNSLKVTRPFGFESADDPFVAPELSLTVSSTGLGGFGDQKLSPTATAFHPAVFLTGNLPSPADSEVGNHSKAKGLVDVNIHSLNEASLPDSSGIVGASTGTPKALVGSLNSLGTFDNVYASGHKGFSTTQGSPQSNQLVITRSLMLEGVDPVKYNSLIASFMERHTEYHIKEIVDIELHTKGRVFVSFWDIRECRLALSSMAIYHPELSATYVKANGSREDRYWPGKNPLQEEGGVVISVTQILEVPGWDYVAIKDVIVEKHGVFGNTSGFKIMECSEDLVRVYVDYFDIRAATDIYERWDGVVFVPKLRMNAIAPTGSPHSPSEKKGSGTKTYSPFGTSYLQRDWTLVNGAPRIDSVSNTAGPMPPLTLNQAPGAIGQERGQLMSPAGIDKGPKARILSYPKGRKYEQPYDAVHHNVVDIDRILEGKDVRTTIMLRNIPNRLDQPMLKAMIDQTSFGKYDFMYLRIDFANNCNVGYAFINFEDPMYIVDFIKDRAGMRWNVFNSDKVAEVSYATIQGSDCLVNKFRNSSVMLENPLYRPKLFRTGDGPHAGQELAFPPVDNPSKMRRSLENAGTTGLYAPRAGQHRRDEQRNRRSRYDRGTTLAVLEERLYEYENRQNFCDRSPVVEAFTAYPPPRFYGHPTSPSPSVHGHRTRGFWGKSVYVPGSDYHSHNYHLRQQFTKRF